LITSAVPYNPSRWTEGSVLTVDGIGHFAFQDINPDVYYLWAEHRQWRSKRQTVVLLSGVRTELKVIV
jgi:hypothetical protein